MAITDLQISDTLETSAPSIRYEGNEGPKSPQEQQQMMMAQLEEEYSKYVFEMEEQGLEPMSLQQFIEQAMAEGQMSSAQPMPNRQMAAYGGIMDVGGRRRYGIGSRLRKLIPNEISRVAEVAAPFVAPFNPLAAGLMSGIGGWDRHGSLGKGLKSGLMHYGGGQAARYLGGADLQSGLSLKMPGGASSGIGQYYSKPTGSNPRFFDDWFKGKETITNKSGVDEETLEELISKKTDSIGDQAVKTFTERQGEIQKGIKKGPSGIMKFIDDNAKWILLGSMGIAAATAEQEDVKEAVNATRGTKLDIDAIRAEVQEALAGGEETWNELKKKYPYIGDFSTKKAEGGRIGLYAGGQSIPSDYTIEDAMMTTTQDKLGGITDVMKQADLFRSGDVGQFYAAQGGRIGYADAGDVRKDPEEVAKTIGGEYQDRGVGTIWPFSLGQDDRAEWAGEQMVEEMQDYKYGKSYPGETEWREDENKNISGLYPFPKSDRPPMSMEETIAALEAKWEEDGPSSYFEDMGIWKKKHIRRRIELGWEEAKGPVTDTGTMSAAQGGRIRAQEGGLMDLGGMEKDYRNDGGFVPIGGKEKADDVPARLSKNEFVFTADAVRGAGGGDIDKGAEIMENVMKNLEQGGQISDESQGLAGAREMFDVSERLSEVV